MVLLKSFMVFKMNKKLAKKCQPKKRRHCFLHCIAGAVSFQQKGGVQNRVLS